MLDEAENDARNKPSSLFCLFISNHEKQIYEGEKKFCDIDTWGQFYKTFYGRKLGIFLII